ncbi:Protein kinase of the Mitotic Exit Network [Marasmius tenuissimus]|uniref:Protein kinase of the Mitotic Exit Network n=1 Tax=Marasmius tenuissimus TaxID=585030 RepID=A0ABR2ZEX6_9AGAR
MCVLRDNGTKHSDGDGFWNDEGQGTRSPTEHVSTDLDEFIIHLKRHGQEVGKAIDSVSPRTAPSVMETIQLDIWKGRLESGHLVCLKVLRVHTGNFNKRNLMKQLGNEVLIWRQLRHPNVHQFLGVTNELFQPSYCIVSPWMPNGDVMSYSRERNSSFEVKITMMRELCEGLRYLHEHNPPIVHSDIKSMNILVSEEGRCHITDFGLCALEDDSLEGHVSETTSQAIMRGSVPWLAPELTNPGCVDTPKQTTRDIYALGCTMYEVFSGSPPFADSKMDVQIILSVLKGLRPMRPAECPHWLWTTIGKSWSENPGSRPTASTIATLLLKPAFTTHLAATVRAMNEEEPGQLLRQTSHDSSCKHDEGTSSASPDTEKRVQNDIDSPIEFETLAKRRRVSSDDEPLPQETAAQPAEEASDRPFQQEGYAGHGRSESPGTSRGPHSSWPLISPALPGHDGTTSPPSTQRRPVQSAGYFKGPGVAQASRSTLLKSISLNGPTTRANTKRVPLACTNCRRRHIVCNMIGEQPCDSCMKRGLDCRLETEADDDGSKLRDSTASPEESAATAEPGVANIVASPNPTTMGEDYTELNSADKTIDPGTSMIPHPPMFQLPAWSPKATVREFESKGPHLTPEDMPDAMWENVSLRVAWKAFRARVGASELDCVYLFSGLTEPCPFHYALANFDVVYRDEQGKGLPSSLR